MALRIETALGGHTTTLEGITQALHEAGYDPPHGSITSLPAPYWLVRGDLELETLHLRTGTLVVTGNLAISGPFDIMRDGRRLTNVIVLGDCVLGLGYLDGFLVVRQALKVHTLICDAAWDGGLFVDGDLAGEEVLLHNTAACVHDTKRVKRFSQDLGKVEPRERFLALLKAPVKKPRKPAKPPARRPRSAKPRAARRR